MIKYYDKHIDESKLLKDNSIFAILVFAPASIITSILTIPFIIITLPSLFFNKSIQEKVLRIGLYIQHAVGLSSLYILEEVICSRSFEWIDVLYGSVVSFIVFYRSIKEMVNETIIQGS